MGFHELSTGLRAVSEDRPEHSSFRDGDFYVQVVPILNPQRSALDPWEYSVMAYLQAWRGKSSSPMNFRAWWDALSEEQQDDVAHSVRHLIEFGPALGFPHSSKVGSSRYPQMRELRTQSAGRPLRTLYAFNPLRSAILLIGGEKTGDDRWYEKFVPIADRLFEEHLVELKKEGRI